MKKTLVHVVHSLNPGGAENLAKEMALEFSEEFKVMVVCLDEVGRWGSKVRERGISVHCMHRKDGIDFSLIYRLGKFFRRHRVDVVHAHQTTPWFYSTLARSLYPHTKILFQEHGRFYPEVKRPVRKLVHGFLISTFTHSIVGVSQDIKDRLCLYEGIPSSRIRVIYNGHNPTSQKRDRVKEFKKSLGLVPEDFVVGTICRFDPIKDLLTLVDALYISAKKIPSIKGLFIGDGPEYSTIKEIIHKKGMENTILLPGHIDNAGEVASALNLFVLPSLSEGISVSLLEAMAAGVPCVVSAVPGNLEVITHGINGYTFPCRKVTSLSHLIDMLYKNPDLAKKIGNRGKDTVEQTFSFSSMINSYREIYSFLTS